MMRPRQRKTVEELYGSKFDGTKSQVAGQQGNFNQKSVRDCGYIITSNTPYNGTMPPNATSVNSGVTKNLNTGRERRKSARPSNKQATEKMLKQENASFSPDDIKREYNIKMKVNRNEKPACYVAPATTPIMYDNKMYGRNYKDVPMEGSPQHHHHHQNHRHNNSRDEEKDDDTDEFFQLIRQTVEKAIGKSISELLNRNFRELSSKIERFSADLNNTNALLNQMQIDINNKIVHFGEENSRHFRYLCMKSEYDKMFYQHQTMAGTAPTINASSVTTSTSNTNAEAKKPEKRKSNPKMSVNTTKMQRNESSKSNPSTNSHRRSITCNSASLELKETRKKSSDDVSQKSSDMGMREVIEHIQKFCNQMQINDVPSNGPGPSQKREIFASDEFLKINKDVFNEDDDEDDVEDEEELEGSSDGMTPRCEVNDKHNYGGITQRGFMTSRGSNGGGDA